MGGGDRLPLPGPGGSVPGAPHPHRHRRLPQAPRAGPRLRRQVAPDPRGARPGRRRSSSSPARAASARRSTCPCSAASSRSATRTSRRLFADLSIWQAGDAYRAHFQRYPVIFLTFKDVKAEHLGRSPGRPSSAKIARALRRAPLPARRAARLSEREARRLPRRSSTAPPAARVYETRAARPLRATSTATTASGSSSSSTSTTSPSTPATSRGYAAEVLDFFRAFLGAGLKGNPHLFKAVRHRHPPRRQGEHLLGPQQPRASTRLLRPEFSTCFGFTEPEVARAPRRRRAAPTTSTPCAPGTTATSSAATVIYNPWSILNFLDQRATRAAGLLALHQLQRPGARARSQRHALAARAGDRGAARGRQHRAAARRERGPRPISARRAGRAVEPAGVLRATSRPRRPTGPPGEAPRYRLSIPNREVREVYTSTFRDWMAQRLGGTAATWRRLTARAARRRRGGAGGAAPGVHRPTCSRTTTRRSGRSRSTTRSSSGSWPRWSRSTWCGRTGSRATGRPDVMIRPRRPGSPGVVLELKVARPGKKTPEQALRGGARADPGEGLRGGARGPRGRAPVHAFAVAFDGKRVSVRGVGRGEETRRFTGGSGPPLAPGTSPLLPAPPASRTGGSSDARATIRQELLHGAAVLDVHGADRGARAPRRSPGRSCRATPGPRTPPPPPPSASRARARRSPGAHVARRLLRVEPGVARLVHLDAPLRSPASSPSS